jgi:type VI secretion system protein ImpF
MARTDQDNSVTLSVLDRLTDLERGADSDPSVGRAQSIRQMKAALRRDLEWLLNTRRVKEEETDQNTELYRSLFNFGLPDITSVSLHSPRDQARLAWLIERTIEIFEPRLKGVRVSLEAPTAERRTLRFLIEGMLMMDPAPERVSFDTLLDPGSGAYLVQGDAGAR